MNNRIQCGLCGTHLNRKPLSLGIHLGHKHKEIPKIQYFVENPEHLELYFEGKYDIDSDGCWIWSGATVQSGYGTIAFTNGNYTREMAAHRVSFWHKTGILPSSDVYVCHTCDKPPCINPDHLYGGDATTNASDCAARGRTAAAKLTFEVIQTLRLSEPYTFEERKAKALEYGVDITTITNALLGLTYKSAGGPLMPRIGRDMAFSKKPDGTTWEVVPCMGRYNRERKIQMVAK